MQTIRLIREELKRTGRGPGNGMFVLQNALREANFPWLKIGGALEPGDVPWFWCWADVPLAIKAQIERQPFILGPNIFFAHKNTPLIAHGECALIDATNCKLMFTESQWYVDLIEKHRGPRNKAPLVVWRYPIAPTPEPPLPVEYDVMIYAKTGFDEQTIKEVQLIYPRSILIRYGNYKRERMIDAARRSACCLYLSDSDRGPLALAEIMLSGCPAVGIPIGAPWIEPYITGVYVSTLDDPLTLAAAVADCIEHCSRERCRAWVMPLFDPAAAVKIIADACLAVLG